MNYSFHDNKIHIIKLHIFSMINLARKIEQIFMNGQAK